LCLPRIDLGHPLHKNHTHIQHRHFLNLHDTLLV
jgi:hypothetical protein